MAESRSNESGISLMEVVVSVFLLGVAAVGVAQLFSLAVLANQSAKGQTSTALLAVQKMEQLRGLAWGYVEGPNGTLGAPIADLTTNLAVEPPTPDGAGLSPSPAGSLDTNTPGYVDFLDERGQWIGTGEQPPNGTVFVRRWSVSPLAENPGETLVLQVVVTTLQREARRTSEAPGPLLDETRLVSVKTRKAL